MKIPSGFLLILFVGCVFVFLGVIFIIGEASRIFHFKSWRPIIILFLLGLILAGIGTAGVLLHW